MKKFILSLFVGFVGFICFGYCEDELMYLDNIFSYDFQGYKYDTYYQDDSVDMLCLKNKTCQGTQLTFSANHTGTGYGSEQGNIGGLGFCTTEGIIYYSLTNANCSITINGYDFHKLSSNECQLEYNLIPISSIDTNYCVGNGFCPNACEGGDGEGDLEFSNLYINNILHPGRENIFINIPDYIYWDYSIDTGNFNLYVGSGYDQDYIDGVLSINTYKPTSEDFTQVFVSGLTLIFPYIFVALFIIFVWKLLKRIFK